MAFNIQTSKLVSWLGVISALITIAGVSSWPWDFLKFDLLLQSVSIPLWMILAIPPVTIAITAFLVSWRQSPRVESTKEQQPVVGQTASVKDWNYELESLQSELNSYKALEKEILSVLGSGLELDLNGLTKLLRKEHSEDGYKKVRLAVASLIDQKRIASNGSAISPKLKFLA